MEKPHICPQDKVDKNNWTYQPGSNWDNIEVVSLRRTIDKSKFPRITYVLSSHLS